MSLKKLVLALFIVNLGYFFYTQGWLQQLMGSDASQREPDRIAKQINAEAISIKTDVSATTSPATVAQACAPVPREQWLIYMGPYASQALSDKKRAELIALGLTSTPISKPSLKLGLSLGQFDSEALARAALVRFTNQGVKTAIVVLWNTTTCP